MARPAYCSFLKKDVVYILKAKGVVLYPESVAGLAYSTAEDKVSETGYQDLGYPAY